MSSNVGCGRTEPISCIDLGKKALILFFKERHKIGMADSKHYFVNKREIKLINTLGWRKQYFEFWEDMYRLRM